MTAPEAAPPSTSDPKPVTTGNAVGYIVAGIGLVALGGVIAKGTRR